MCSSSTVQSSYVPGQPIDHSGGTEYYWKDPLLGGDTYERTLAGDMEKFGKNWEYGNKLFGFESHKKVPGKRVSSAAFEAITKAKEFGNLSQEEKLAAVERGDYRWSNPTYSRMMEFIAEFGAGYNPEDPVFANAPNKYNTWSEESRIPGTNSISTVRKKELNPEWTAWVKKTKRDLKIRSGYRGQFYGGGM